MVTTPKTRPRTFYLINELYFGSGKPQRLRPHTTRKTSTDRPVTQASHQLRCHHVLSK
jgi:hypothetical protein